MPHQFRPIQPVLRRLASLSPLSSAEVSLIERLPDRTKVFAVGDDLAAAASEQDRPRYVISGWLARQRVLPDGRRQIFSFVLPGDGIGLTWPWAPAAASLIALTRVETVDATVVRDAAQGSAFPGLSAAMGRSASLEEGRLLDHLVRLGRQTATERLAHLLMELQHRLAETELRSAWRFRLPLTQEVLADALGLSAVHVNRTLQRLRREVLIDLRGGVLTILAPAMLAARGGFPFGPSTVAGGHEAPVRARDPGSPQGSATRPAPIS